MSFFTQQKEIQTGGTGALRPGDDVVSNSAPARRKGKWPLRWVTLGVLTVCSAFWIAFFALIF